MKGLLYKDLTTLIAAYKTNILLVLVLYLFLTLAMDMTFMLYASMFIFAMYPLSCLTFDELSHWDVYARTLPVKKADILGSKYLLSLMTMGTGLVFCLAATVVNDLVHGRALAETLGPNIAGMVAALVVGLLYFAITCPLSCKIGSNKARTSVMVVPMILVALIILARTLAGPFDLSFLEAISDTQFMLFLAGVFAATLAGFFISWRISTRIYTRKSY